MTNYSLAGNCNRYGIEPDGHSRRFSTVLAENHYYAEKRIRELEQRVAKLEAALREIQLMARWGNSSLAVEIAKEAMKP
jgi:hypothetical protein